MHGETPLYKNPQVTTAVTQYAEDHSTPLPKYIIEHREWSMSSFPGDPEMMISPLQAQFQTFLVRALDVRRILEVGCWVGFSGLTWESAIRGKEGAHVTTLDLDCDAAKVAAKRFEDPELGGRVQLVTGDARETYVAKFFRQQTVFKTIKKLTSMTESRHSHQSQTTSHTT
jgi:predicted O-methyltransferase YrrM